VAAVILFHSLLRRAIYGRILSRKYSEDLVLLSNLQECLEKMQQEKAPTDPMPMGAEQEEQTRQTPCLFTD
jgi:hypothetical protein